jgi:maleylacetate reductase
VSPEPASRHDFSYEMRAARVVFGFGTLARLPEEVDRLGLARVLVLATPQQEKDAHALARTLGARAAAVFAGATMHTPVSITEDALDVVRAHDVDGLVAVGGGSTTGLAKAIALRTDLPQIVAPTTYAGSEMTPILGQTENGSKTTLSSPKVLPEVVIYDVETTFGLPASMSATSGMNAIAHAVEALYARDRNPVTDLLAAEGIAALGRALPRISRDGHDREARADALYGAWLCGMCLGTVGMAFHHKLCHTLGGSFDLPHAETHTVVLPHALAFNAPAAPDAARRVAAALDVADPARGLFDLAGTLGAPRSLRELGLRDADIDAATDRALANPYWNPRPLERDAVRDVIARATAGEAPAPWLPDGAAPP